MYQPVRAGKKVFDRYTYKIGDSYNKRVDKECLKKLFKRYIITKMKEWRSQGDRLILMLDANEDTKNGNLAWAIRSNPKLKMKDLVRERACKDGPSTWFCGTMQINGTFSTPDVDFYGSSLLPFWYSMRYLKAVLVEVPHQYLLGEQVLQVFCPEARRLKCGLTGPKLWYLQKREILFQEHKVYSKASRICIFGKVPYSSRVHNKATQFG